MKMRLILVLICLITASFYSITSSGQPIKILEKQINVPLSIEFSYEKELYGNFYLELIFSQIVNATPISFKETISSKNGSLFILKPLTTMSQIGYRYNYSYVRGMLNPKVDNTYEYILPFSKGKTAMVADVANINSDYFGSALPGRWKAFQFFMNPGDTVFAARKGVVVEITDGFEPDPTKSFAYNSNSNSVLVEHEDGTLAYYGILKSKSIMVKVGQTIFPHSPIAIAGTLDTDDHTQIRFYVYFLTNGNVKDENKMASSIKSIYYSFVDPVFYTQEGSIHLTSMHKYTADYTSDLLIRELSKKEIKKLGRKD